MVVHDDDVSLVDDGQQQKLTCHRSIITLGARFVVFATGLAILKRYDYSIAWSALWHMGWGTPSYKALLDWRQPKTVGGGY